MRHGEKPFFSPRFPKFSPQKKTGKNTLSLSKGEGHFGFFVPVNFGRKPFAPVPPETKKPPGFFPPVLGETTQNHPFYMFFPPLKKRGAGQKIFIEFILVITYKSEGPKKGVLTSSPKVFFVILYFSYVLTLFLSPKNFFFWEKKILKKKYFKNFSFQKKGF